MMSHPRFVNVSHDVSSTFRECFTWRCLTQVSWMFHTTLSHPRFVNVSHDDVSSKFRECFTRRCLIQVSWMFYMTMSHPSFMNVSHDDVSPKFRECFTWQCLTQVLWMFHMTMSHPSSVNVSHDVVSSTFCECFTWRCLTQVSWMFHMTMSHPSFVNVSHDNVSPKFRECFAWCCLIHVLWMFHTTMSHPSFVNVLHDDVSPKFRECFTWRCRTQVSWMFHMTMSHPSLSFARKSRHLPKDDKQRVAWEITRVRGPRFSLLKIACLAQLKTLASFRNMLKTEFVCCFHLVFMHCLTFFLIQVSELAIIHTSVGDIQLKLFPSECPKTTENFCVHSRNGYYNGHIFHRVIKVTLLPVNDQQFWIKLFCVKGPNGRLCKCTLAEPEWFHAVFQIQSSVNCLWQQNEHEAPKFSKRI